MIIGLYSSSDYDTFIFIFNSNKLKFDFMFSEGNVLLGKKTFMKYFSFKQISNGKYFLFHLICKSKHWFVYMNRHAMSILQKL